MSAPTEFTVKFSTNNAAFDEPLRDEEIARILREIAVNILRGDYHRGHSKTILDVNGNDIGRYRFGEVRD